MTGSAFLAALNWNLSRFDGYVAVNNHMGSRLTQDMSAMKTVLSLLDEKELFFVDSLTTSRSVASAAGRAVGADVYARDVFLDASKSEASVMAQLALIERIARETGFAVAICHPRKDTLAAVGPWLTSAPARGFQIETVAALPELAKNWRARPVIASTDISEKAK
jgi:hypothetical protein